MPYSGKFLHGAKFCSFHGKFGCCKNKNHENFQHSALHALASTTSLTVGVVLLSARMKFRTTKISSEGLDGNSVNLCTSKIFLIYISYSMGLGVWSDCTSNNPLQLELHRAHTPTCTMIWRPLSTMVHDIANCAHINRKYVGKCQ